MVYRRNLLLDCMDFHGKCHQKMKKKAWQYHPAKLGTQPELGGVGGVFHFDLLAMPDRKP